MKKKINSLTAGGQARSEIFPGDIFRDNRGERVTVKIVADNRITYIREGYSGECVFPVERFIREFWPVKRQTFSEWCESNNTAEKIHNLRALICVGSALTLARMTKSGLKRCCSLAILTRLMSRSCSSSR